MISQEQKLTLPTRLVRCLRLLCPGCGRNRLFTGWFSMFRTCPQCGRRHERAPGFFLGSIYFNYGVTAVIVTGLYLGLYFGTEVASTARLSICAVVSLLLPVLFFRHARSLWITFDEFWDPWNEREK